MKCAEKIRGVSLVETVVAVAIFAFVALGLYGSYAQVLKVVRKAQTRVVATSLATERFEIIRNLPYNLVGLKNGIPSGVLDATSTVVRGGLTFDISTIVRSIDLPFDGLAPSDTNPADNKIVEISLTCSSCTDLFSTAFTAQVGPKDLEASSTLGSLFVRAIDATGKTVPGASVHVVFASSTAPIDYTDTTGANGMLQLVGIAPAVNEYQVSVTKSGYSSDRTYSPFGPTTTHPILPHATVATGTVTQLTFAIDTLSSLRVMSVSPSCASVSSVPFTLTGTKLIGTEPLYKYAKSLSTDASGLLALPLMEWDTYTLLASKVGYDLVGVIPSSPFALLPGAAQDVQLVFIPSTGNSDDNTIMVSVADGVTGLPLSGASVVVEKSGEPTQNLTTGRGFLSQSDWSGGSAQELFVDKTAYFGDDGNVDVSSSPGSMHLRNLAGNYVSLGILTSSVFDTGALSNFYQFRFSPTVQPALTSVAFQLAGANATSGPWVYLGPDGTAATYYSATTTDISAAISGNRYIRYQATLTTGDSTKTPVVDDLSFTFSTACVSPGQTHAQGLENGTWKVTVSLPGYSSEVQNITLNSTTPWASLSFTLDPI